MKATIAHTGVYLRRVLDDDYVIVSYSHERKARSTSYATASSSYKHMRHGGATRIGSICDPSRISVSSHRSVKS